MKKTCISSLYGAMCLGLAILVASCGHKEASAESFTALGSADDAVVATGHAADVIRNAACVYGENGIEVSRALEKIIANGASPREKVNIDNALKIRGVDMEECFYKVTPDGDMVLAFALTDDEAFRQWLVEDMEVGAPVSDGGYDVYAIESKSKIFANGEAAYVVAIDEGECNLAAFNSIKERAAANPLAGWQKDVLAQTKTFVALVKASECIEAVGEENINALGSEYYDIEIIKNGYAEVSADLKGLRLNVSLAFRDINGQSIKPKTEIKPVDLEIFKYINKDDNFAFALNIPEKLDWKEVIEAIDKYTDGQISRGSNKMVMNKIVEVLGNVDGSVFISAHPKNLMLAGSGLQYWHATLGAQMKKGAAASYINEIKTLASAYGISATAKAGATVIELAPFTFYLKDVDGMFVLSTQPIESSSATLLSKEYFKGQIVALEATLAKGAALLSDDAALPFQPIVALSSDGEKVSFDVELVGEGEYLLDVLFSFIAGAFN